MHPYIKTSKTVYDERYNRTVHISEVISDILPLPLPNTLPKIDFPLPPIPREVSTTPVYTN